MLNPISTIRKTALALVALALTMSGAAVAQAKSPVPGKPGDANIVAIASAVNAASGEFSYLLAAVGCLTADDGSNAVAALLSGDDKYTLFAPTDEAFKAVQRALGVEAGAEDPAITCAALDDATIFNVLAYHVTDGRRFSNSVFNVNNVKSIAMLNGDYIMSNPNLTLDSIGAQGVGIALDADDNPMANIDASNGVIHVIDTVLLPFTL